jgi:hypothetical protein
MAGTSCSEIFFSSLDTMHIFFLFQHLQRVYWGNAANFEEIFGFFFLARQYTK